MAVPVGRRSVVPRLRCLPAELALAGRRFRRNVAGRRASLRNLEAAKERSKPGLGGLASDRLPAAPAVRSKSRDVEATRSFYSMPAPDGEECVDHSDCQGGALKGPIRGPLSAVRVGLYSRADAPRWRESRSSRRRGGVPAGRFGPAGRLVGFSPAHADARHVVRECSIR